MPAKKSKKTEEKLSSFDFQKLMNGSDSYKSLAYGIVTVVVLFIVIALGIRTLQQNKAQIDEEALSTQNVDVRNQTSTYTVTEGDTLWSIAEKTFNDGFRWNEIAKANNITDASTLEKGMELTIPMNETEDTDQVMDSPDVDASPTAMTSPIEPSPTVSQTPSATPTIMVSPTAVPTQSAEPTMANEQKINGNTYSIVEGDTLWDIAVRAYGDGYKWVDIAKSNKIANPDLIYPGTSLQIAR